MHDINYTHQHELEDHNFATCCKDCEKSVNIIKPHIIGFAERIREYDRDMLAKLSMEELYQIYQILDDLAHMETGEHLANLVLKEPDILHELPLIRSYYTLFFNIHETHLAKELLKSDNPWKTLKSFSLYSRYETLIRNQIDAMYITKESRMAFVGCGMVPLSLILMAHLYDLPSVGIDISSDVVEQAKKVIKILGLDEKINIIQGDESTLKNVDWNMVLVAALAEPKARIFQTIQEIMKERHKEAPVIFRTYTGMRAVLYHPVQPDDISGFRITKEIFPVGRVNNTTVFARLEQ